MNEAAAHEDTFLSMTDTEVENTLREIRERVRAESQALARTRGGDGDVAPGPSSDDEGAAARARLEANLAVLERTRDKLPPLLSYRSGLAARVELWVKRQIKRATHWFTWEQVNFNSAATYALRDALAALGAQERRLAEQAERMAEQERRLAEQERGLDAQEKRLASIKGEAEARAAELRGAVSEVTGWLRSETDSLRSDDEALRSEARSLRTALDAARAEVSALRAEERERVEHLAEEHRVSFRQLSLEATENAVAFDRARRGAEARVEELARRVEEIEKAVKSDE